MTRSINLTQKTVNAMVHDYAVLNQSLAEIGKRYGMSKTSARNTIAATGTRIRSKTEHHSFKTGKQVQVANMPAPTSVSANGLLADLLSLGHITQAEIDSLATPAPTASVAPVTISSPAGVSFAGMTQGQKERAGLQEVMRIVAETSKVTNLRQQQYADLWGRSGSWVSHNQAK